MPSSGGTFRPYTVAGRTYYPLKNSDGFVQTGHASWYGAKFHGRKTASGETYNMYAMTAAHKTLPMNTIVQVFNLENGRTALVRINDRGPFVDDRIIDLSYAAANRLGVLQTGTAKVTIRAIGNAAKEMDNTIKQGYDNKLYVQVGSFGSAENAWRLRRELASKYGEVAVVAHKGLYRVQVFAGTGYDRAKKLAEELRHAGFKNAYIVAR